MAQPKPQPFVLHLNYLPFKMRLALIWALIESLFGMTLSITFYGVPADARNDPNSKDG